MTKCKWGRITEIKLARTFLVAISPLPFHYLSFRHAAQCKAFIPFINVPWCNSRECAYEFKIAVRKNLVNKGIPAIMPLLLEDFKVYDEYPMASLSPHFFVMLLLLYFFNSIFLKPKQPVGFFSFLTICIYPSVYGVLCSTNGIRVNPSELGLKTWATVLDSLQMQNVLPTSKLLLSKPDFPAPSAPGSVIPSKWLFLFSLFLRW